MFEGRIRSLPRKFRTTRIVVAGCGQVGQALLNHFQNRDFTATYRPGAESNLKAVKLRSLNAKPVAADLSNPSSLKRLAKLGHRVIWMAAPNSEVTQDFSLKRFCLAQSQSQTRWGNQPNLVYVSTTGVYGDTQGGWVTERSHTNAQSSRAMRRVHAEKQLQIAFRTARVNAKLVRAPGIYSSTRLPIERLKRESPALSAHEDSYSNHIHEVDLARICLFALFKARPWDVINAVDEQPSKMGDYFDEVAEHFGLPKPRRLSREQAKAEVSPMMWSFMRESRRVKSLRIKQLGFQLKYPKVTDFLATLPAQADLGK